jgi:hypothetical protein
VGTREENDTFLDAWGKIGGVRHNRLRTGSIEPQKVVGSVREKVDPVEYLIGYEGNAFAFTGDVEEDLLSITAVHPMREDAVDAFLARAGADGSVVQQLVDRGQLIETEYGERTFYMRKLHLGASEA